jgi:hypothetical protein
MDYVCAVHGIGAEEVIYLPATHQILGAFGSGQIEDTTACANGENVGMKLPEPAIGNHYGLIVKL